MTNSQPATDSVWSVAAEIDRICEQDTESSGFLFVHRLEGDRRADVLRTVFFDSDPNWLSAFVAMLLLSGGIATLGLSQDSAATVIGSMIIAPPGAPIVGLGGAIAVAWPREAVRMLATVLAGAAGVVLVAFMIGMLLPDTNPTAQILARTDPDLRDLGVAVLAGSAGGYAHTRATLSSSLVGVAIAVALVPPLAAVGLMLEESRWILAEGAITLFAANFIGITVAVAVVLLVTGFVPRPRLRNTGGGTLAGLLGAGLALAVVAVPLTVAYRRVMQTTGLQSDTYRQVLSTADAATSGIQVDSVDVTGNEVRIRLAGSGAAPAPEEFEADLRDEFGDNVHVIVE
ncbi:MAG: DUF389 domain-containing protein [Acidimicrobiia bacterium]|nr:DUF389 domain-containing protein [Acidimicrobiia bacterium]